MAKPTLNIKKRIIFSMFLFFLIMVILIIRLGKIQLIDGDKYKKEAFSQWSRDITINAGRGTIYDRKGKKLAVSAKSDTVVCFPSDVVKSQNNNQSEINNAEQTGVLFEF